MRHLHPAIQTGLTYAGVHQAIAVCGLMSVFVSEYVFTLFGIGLLIVDLPVVWINAIFRDAAWIHWEPPVVRVAPAAPMEALRFYQGTIAFILIAGALQWFLIGVSVVTTSAHKRS